MYINVDIIINLIFIIILNKKQILCIKMAIDRTFNIISYVICYFYIWLLNILHILTPKYYIYL